MTSKNLASTHAETSNKKRGRPSRNPVEVLRTKIFIYEVCRIAEIKFTGYQLEQLFEPNQIIKKDDGSVKRGCKWDRFVNGSHSPSQETLTLIFAKYPEYYFLRDLYYSPLWTALAAGDHDNGYWLRFYRKLPFNIQKNIFKPQSAEERKQLQSKSIDAISRQWDIQSLACLIALLRDKKFRHSPFEFDYIEITVYKILIHECCQQCFMSFIEEIWKYIKQHIVSTEQHYIPNRGLWDVCSRITFKSIAAISANICLAEDLGLILPGKLTQEFLYWKDKGNNKLIVEEMFEARKVERYELKNSNKGLKWLTDKLNKSRPKLKQTGDYI